MYTEPKIVNADGPGRPYITFSFNGIRQRVSSGRVIGLNIFPLKAKTHEERIRSLQTLKAELLKALAADKYPVQSAISNDPELHLILSAVNQLTMEAKQANALNEQRLAKLEQIHDQLTDYLSQH